MNPTRSHQSIKQKVSLIFLALISGLFMTAAVIHAANAQADVQNLVSQFVVQGWVQSNISGFGSSQSTWVNALGVYDGFMYAGVQGNPAGGQLWRTEDGQNWVAVNTNGFGDSNTFPESFGVLSDTFYLGTRNNVSGAGIYTSTDGLNWTNVITGGFGITQNATIINMMDFNGYLYAATVDDVESSIGGQVWRTSNGINWTNVVTNNFGLGASNPNAWWSFEIFNNHLYAGTGGYTGSGLLYRTSDGVNWTPVTNDGFGDVDNVAIPCLANFNGYIYACTRTIAGVGAQVWRSNTGDPGSWVQVASGGLGNPDYNRPYGLIVAGNTLYLTITIRQSLYGSLGDQIWRTTDGINWVLDVSNGWGDPNNAFSDYSDKGATVFNDSIYIGTENSVTGGQIWRRLQQLHLPLIVRNLESFGLP